MNRTIKLTFKSTRISLFACLLVAVWGEVAPGAVFNLTYDDNADGVIVLADVVGTGIFSYDGPATAGSFLLSDLTGVSYSSTFTGSIGFSGPPFDPPDLSLIGISVTPDGGDGFELIFTGSSAMTNGSLDIRTETHLLTHVPNGLAGPNRYAMEELAGGTVVFGDYLGIVIPEPSAFALCAPGLLSLGMIGRWRRCF